MLHPSMLLLWGQFLFLREGGEIHWDSSYSKTHHNYSLFSYSGCMRLIGAAPNLSSTGGTAYLELKALPGTFVQYVNGTLCKALSLLSDSICASGI